METTQASDAAAATAAGTGTAAAEAVVAPIGKPFAVIDEVADHSPASAAGIRVGDQLCR